MTGHVQDLWFRTVVENGKRTRVKTARHGKGKRYQARWIEDGLEKAKAFEFKAAAEQHVATVLVNPTRPRPKVTFGDYYETWRQSRLHHRSNSARNVEVAYRLTIAPTLGRLPLADITRMDIQNAIIEWQTHHKPSTVHVYYGYVSTVFKSAILDELIVKSPCRKISLPPRTKDRVIPLTAAQVKTIADNMPPTIRAAVVLVAATGIRIGELGGLTYDRIHDHSITIDRQLVAVKDREPVFGPPKSSASNRDVPLGGVAWNALQEHVEAHPDNAHGLVFTAARGGPLARHAASALWRDATQGMGLGPRSGWHSLRHFHASSLISAGLSPRAVADRLGHANPNITLGIYSHLWDNDTDRIVSATDVTMAVFN